MNPQTVVHKECLQFCAGTARASAASHATAMTGPTASRLSLTLRVINGEAVIARDGGTPDFHALRSRRRGHEAVLYAFDLIGQRRHLIVRIAPATTGCYGFDQGPVYSPKPCHFPYNCEMFDGACGRNRAWAHTIDR